ncbi:MAG: SAM-dependent methyltransferase [Bacillota bacterium]|nr:SAM-dependent methyltransferase [Bacillota bacterium]
MKNISELLKQITEEGSLIRLVLGNKRKKSLPYQKITVRPFSSGESLMYQAEYVYPSKVIHENLTADEFPDFVQSQIAAGFKQANLFTANADYQVLAAKPENPRITKSLPSMRPQSLEHNNTKKYIIPDGTPCDFMIRLGVMNDSGQVLKKHYGKFRQINRFLEIAGDVINHLPKDRTVKIIDFGCGKAYLTFALYYYLKKQLGMDVDIVGLDLKADVINFCSETASSLGYDGLRFEIGDIAEYQDTHADMVVTLHACDTATDFALINAKNWDASVILSVPCCQHELFGQMENELHNPMLKQGILRERFCAILTDTFRQLKLEEWGYEVSMIEFTSLEHTAKNIMIRAVSTGRPSKRAAKQCRELMNFWNVNPSIVKFDR